MKTFLILAYICLSFQCVLCRDFYMGLFRKNDFLVAQDNLYKERRSYSFVHAEYGRLFKCPITYFRIVDRLGVRGGVTTTVVRGGLLKKYITVRLKSCYNCPISVNIYVGCDSKKTTPKPTSTEDAEANVTSKDSQLNNTAEGENGDIAITTLKASDDNTAADNSSNTNDAPANPEDTATEDTE